MTSQKESEKPVWTPQRQKAFEDLKQAITEDTVLKSPSLDKPFLLYTDASTTGIGAMLAQEDKQGEERPVAFFSQTLRPYQHNYCVTELEMLALVRAIDHFSFYLYGRHFLTYTDHKALLSHAKLKSANTRLMRWSMFLQQYNFTLNYKPGKDNIIADLMSRQEEHDKPVLLRANTDPINCQNPDTID